MPGKMTDPNSTILVKQFCQMKGISKRDTAALIMKYKNKVKTIADWQTELTGQVTIPVDSNPKKA